MTSHCALYVLVLACKIVICDAPLFIHSWQPNTSSIKQLDNSGIKYSYYILRKSSHQLIVYMKTGGIIIFKLYPLLNISFSIQRAWPQISSSKEALNVGEFSPRTGDHPLLSGQVVRGVRCLDPVC